MKFEVDGKSYVVTSDQYQWILNEVKVSQKTGVERLEAVGYYPRFSHMADKLVRLGVPGAGGDVVKSIERLEATLARLESREVRQ